MPKRLLGWDAPNMDQVLASLVGGRPTARQRPNFERLLDWHRARASDGTTVEAAVFVNVTPEAVLRLSGWVMWLRSAGYRVFTKPKSAGGGSDIDAEMRTYLTGTPPHDVEEVVIGSHDAEAFLEVGEELSQAGAKVTAIGFRELAGGLGYSEYIDFVDLEDIPGLLEEPPPRMNLTQLPAEGRWWEPDERGSAGQPSAR